MNEEGVIEKDEYLTVERETSCQIRVRGSRFIATLSPAVDHLRAEEFLSQIRSKYHDATHNCFAFRLAGSQFRFSDDGEPSGTAGRPILAMVDKYRLQNVILVVTRYFGGTKLGTGGLIRAYTDCAEKVIQQARIQSRYHYDTLYLQYPFNLVNKIQHLVHRFQARIREDATGQGMFSEIQIYRSQKILFCQELETVSKGQARIVSPGSVKTA